MIISTVKRIGNTAQLLSYYNKQKA